MEEYDSALIYFNNILSEYYDTEIIDDVRISIIFLYLLQNKTDIAISYLEEQKLKFVSSKKLSEAENLIIKMKMELEFQNILGYINDCLCIWRYFNPPHKGHLEIVERLIPNCDRLYIMPLNYLPQYGKSKMFTSSVHRFEMCKIAFEEISSKIEVSNL